MYCFQDKSFCLSLSFNVASFPVLFPLLCIHIGMGISLGMATSGMTCPPVHCVPYAWTVLSPPDLLRSPYSDFRTQLIVNAPTLVFLMPLVYVALFLCLSLSLHTHLPHDV